MKKSLLILLFGLSTLQATQQDPAANYHDLRIGCGSALFTAAGTLCVFNCIKHGWLSMIYNTAQKAIQPKDIFSIFSFTKNYQTALTLEQKSVESFCIAVLCFFGAYLSFKARNFTRKNFSCSKNTDISNLFDGSIVSILAAKTINQDFL